MSELNPASRASEWLRAKADALRLHSSEGMSCWDACTVTAHRIAAGLAMTDRVGTREWFSWTASLEWWKDPRPESQIPENATEEWRKTLEAHNQKIREWEKWRQVSLIFRSLDLVVWWSMSLSDYLGAVDHPAPSAREAEKLQDGRELATALVHQISLSLEPAFVLVRSAGGTIENAVKVHSPEKLVAPTISLLRNSADMFLGDIWKLYAFLQFKTLNRADATGIGTATLIATSKARKRSGRPRKYDDFIAYFRDRRKMDRGIPLKCALRDWNASLPSDQKYEYGPVLQVIARRRAESKAKRNEAAQKKSDSETT